MVAAAHQLDHVVFRQSIQAADKDILEMQQHKAEILHELDIINQVAAPAHIDFHTLDVKISVAIDTHYCVLLSDRS